MGDFRDELQSLLNHWSKENGSNTPDFVLAAYLAACLEAFDAATQEREKWYGHGHVPEQTESSFTKTREAGDAA